MTAPLASQLQEPEELVSSLEKVQIQNLIVNSISQAHKTFFLYLHVFDFNALAFLELYIDLTILRAYVIEVLNI